MCVLVTGELMLKLVRMMMMMSDDDGATVQLYPQSSCRRKTQYVMLHRIHSVSV